MADTSAGTMTAAMSISLSLVEMNPERLAKYVEDVNGRVRNDLLSAAIRGATRSLRPFETTRDHDSPTL